MIHRARLNWTAWCAQLRLNTTRSLWMPFGTARSKTRGLVTLYSLALKQCTNVFLRRFIAHKIGLIVVQIPLTTFCWVKSLNNNKLHTIGDEYFLGCTQAIIYNASDAFDDFLGGCLWCLVLGTPKIAPGWDWNSIFWKVHVLNSMFKFLWMEILRNFWRYEIGHTSFYCTNVRLPSDAM